MNNTLTALLTKLFWQKQQLNQSLDELAQELGSLQNKLSNFQEKIAKACEIYTLISPEKEISRLNFIIHCQQDNEKLELAKKELEARQAQLLARRIRLDTELKMLEKYQLNQSNHEQKLVLDDEQKSQDEWALLRRIDDEN
ncbi:MAG: hypothetical protein H0U70_03250 [Tatlockia sp.]|nr:hypothetical protein [Tatlockia sp.]